MLSFSATLDRDVSTWTAEEEAVVVSTVAQRNSVAEEQVSVTVSGASMRVTATVIMLDWQLAHTRREAIKASSNDVVATVEMGLNTTNAAVESVDVPIVVADAIQSPAR